ncbi:MAG: hypothetical protein IKJ39_09035 [Lachnospiraceae bacterium]|nr:hypothetical protein [Lachnospiraceae bacterium]MBR3825328.1 hypothetical protein [Lachnospiraceae bacterium]
MASLIFDGYLVWVSWQDVQEMQVVRYSHLLGVLAFLLQVVIKMMTPNERELHSMVEYLSAGLVLLVLQILAHFLNLYGLGDVIVFFLCGLYMLLEKGVEHYLLAYFMVQALSGSLLLVVQFLKGNIKGMRLKAPIPYIPYISVAFILTNMVL